MRGLSDDSRDTDTEYSDLMHSIRDHLSHFYVADHAKDSIMMGYSHDNNNVPNYIENRISRIESDISEIKRMIEQINQKLLRNGVI